MTDPVAARRLTTSFVPDQLRPYSIVWNAGVQRVFREDYTVEVRYLGSRGVHLALQQNLNRPSGITPERSLPLFLSRPSQADLDRLTLTRANLAIGAATDPLVLAGFPNAITAFMPQGNSIYHGLATQVNKRFSQGVQFVGSYTWSHAIDDSTASLNSTVLTPRRPQDFNNLRPERASSALDRRHRFTLGWVYETPWLRDSGVWALKNLLGNWLLSGAYTIETGAWATARSGFDANLNGDTAGDRVIINTAGDANRGSDVTALTNSAGAIVGYLANDPTARYIRTREGMYPNSGRNTIRLPRINNFDLAAGKRINITERVRTEIKAEFYNALNHAQFTAGIPNSAYLRTRTGAAETSMLLPGNPIFLRPDLAFQSNSRTGQLVLRVEF